MFLGLSGLHFLFCIAVCELTLAWNPIGKAYNLTEAGQIIPLAISVTGACRIIWAAWQRRQNLPEVDEMGFYLT